MAVKYNGWNAPGFKDTGCCFSSDGEDFTSALEEGCLYDTPEKVTQRSLKHIEQRDAKVLRENAKGDFRPYDETETVNQS